MKAQVTMQVDQLQKFARFLDEHPGFWPELEEENALVCGFHIGGCFLTIAEMDRLIEIQPCLGVSPTALLLVAPPVHLR